MSHLFIRIGAVFCALGVGFGAFGSHGLKAHVTPAMLSAYKTGVFYHLIHALGVLIIGILIKWYPNRTLVVAGSTMSIGIILFAGSLYLLAITGIRSIGWVTPFGGAALIVAWLILVWGIRPNKDG